MNKQGSEERHTENDKEGGGNSLEGMKNKFNVIETGTRRMRNLISNEDRVRYNDCSRDL